MQKRQIQFHETMGSDKRSPSHAYLRKGAFASHTPGLYPAVDFKQESPIISPTSEEFMDIIGSNEGQFKIKVFNNAGTDLEIYDLGDDTKKEDVNHNFECGCMGPDGIHYVGSDKQVRRAEHLSDTVTALGTALSGTMPHIAVCDGLYYWYISKDEIYKQLAGDAPTVAFNDVGIEADFAVPHGSQMVLFAQSGSDIVAQFWDKSDTDLFDKRVLIKNATLIAAGDINGTLTLVKGVGNSSNNKEREGEITVAQYNGESFVDQNSIKAGDEAVTNTNRNAVGVGNKIMVVAIDGNEDEHNDDLYQNYVLKIGENAEIEVIHTPDPDHGDVHVARVFYNFIALMQNGSGSNPDRLLTNVSTSTLFHTYEDFSETTYITEFMGNIFNRHGLEGIAVAFEKLFEQTDDEDSEGVTEGEELDIYYRVSERDDFTLLGTIDAKTVRDEVNLRRDQSTEYDSNAQALPEQAIMITKLPNGSHLPEFHEIQYKFVSKYGFSIIDAWDYYDYLSRTTIE